VSFGLTFDKLILIAVLALILIGPERLPGYAKRLGEWARQLRDWLGGARERIRDEVGPEFDDIDWKQLDPRQYDPRRIVREALAEPLTGAAGAAGAAAATGERETAYAQRQRRIAERAQARAAQEAGAPTPFDSEAT